MAHRGLRNDAYDPTGYGEGQNLDQVFDVTTFADGRFGLGSAFQSATTPVQNVTFTPT
jgi:hypothetical protein